MLGCCLSRQPVSCRSCANLPHLLICTTWLTCQCGAARQHMLMRFNPRINGGVTSWAPNAWYSCKNQMPGRPNNSLLAGQALAAVASPEAAATGGDRVLVWLIMGLTSQVDTEYLRPGRLLACINTYFTVFSNGVVPVKDIQYKTGEPIVALCFVVKPVAATCVRRWGLFQL